LVYKKNNPVPDKNIEPQHNERINQLKEEAAAVSCEYKLDDYDIQELVFDKMCEKFPDTHFVDISKLIRVQVGNTAKNYLIIYTEEYVTDNIQFKTKKFTRKRIGFHPIIQGTPEYDNYGTLTGYNIGTSKCSFDIEFEPNKVKKIIAAARSGPKELLIAKGALMGENPITEPPRTCFNLNDFLYGDFDLLMEAGRLNYLNSGPGFEEFQKIRAANLENATPRLITATTTKENADKKE
jgi:hypothetical protein